MSQPRLGLLFIVFCAAAAQGCNKKTAKLPAAPTPTAAVVPTVAVPPAAATPTANRVEVAVTDEGFVPSRIPAKAGVPVTLAITRKVDRTCATEILFAGQEGKTELPLNKTVEVTYTPKAAGDIKFGCGMGMMIGGVIAAAP